MKDSVLKEAIKNLNISLAQKATQADIDTAIASLPEPGDFTGNLDDIPEGTTNKHLTASEKANLHAPGSDNQDLSGYALKNNVLELDNTTPFTPDNDYEPATKKYVDDNAGGIVIVERGIVIDGDGSVITTGIKTPVLTLYGNGTILGWDLSADVSGSIVIDVDKTSYANFPSGFTSIAGSEKPTLSSAQKNQDLTLTTWTTSFSDGDKIRFEVESVSNITNIVLTLFIQRD